MPQVIVTAIGLGNRLLRRAYLGKLDVQVLCHEAQLQTPYVADAVFINVTNRSPSGR
jgi:hypothetical protein